MSRARRFGSAALGGVERLLAKRSASPRARRRLLLAAVVLFVGVTVLSVRALPDNLRLHWWPIPLLLVTTPCTVLLNAAEFRAMGAINGHVVGWVAAVRLTVVAGAANLLPLPGGVVVRTQALRLRGSSYQHALAANAAAGVAWLGTGCVVVGMLLAVNPDHRLAAGPLVLAGGVCLVGVTAILRRVDRARVTGNLSQLLLIETGAIAVGGARLFLLFEVLGLSASIAQAITLTSSQIIAAAVGIFPAGLGLRELLAGGIGALVALPAGAAVAVTALDRIAMQAVLGLLAALLLIKGKEPVGTDPLAATQIVRATQDHLP